MKLLAIFFTNTDNLLYFLSTVIAKIRYGHLCPSSVKILIKLFKGFSKPSYLVKYQKTYQFHQMEEAVYNF